MKNLSEDIKNTVDKECNGIEKEIFALTASQVMTDRILEIIAKHISTIVEVICNGKL